MMPSRLAITAAIYCALLSGCTTHAGGPTAWNPATWFSGREAAQLTSATGAHDAAEAAVLKAAQQTAHQTQGHLMLAPASPAVDNAREANDTTVALLDQVAGPLTAEQAQQIKTLVAGLNSQIAAERTAAERARASERSNIIELSNRLSVTAAKLDSAHADIAAGFEREHVLADQLRNANLIKWAGVAGTAIMGLAAFAYSANLGRLQQGVGRALGGLAARYGASDVDLVAAQHEIDALVSVAQQRAIQRFYAPIAAATATGLRG